MAERKRRRLTNRMQDGCAYVQSETGKEGVGHYTTQRRLPELITFTCKVEDILEKYDLKVEELDERIYNGAMNYVDKLKAEADRDTWKRACELACDVLRDINYKIYNEDRIDFENTFYQQAKKEGNDE